MTLPLIYNLRNLAVRKLSTGLTLAVVAVVVFMLVVLLAYAVGIRETLSANGSPLNLVVLKPGATAESTSILRQVEWIRAVQTPGIGQGAAGELLVSYELCVQTNINRKGTDKLAYVAVRGVDPVAFQVHPEIRIVEGRDLQTGELECIVGKAARAHFEGLEVGKSLVMGRVGNHAYKIVGVVESNGGSLESEILASRAAITNSFNRQFISSIAARLSDPGQVDAALEYLNGPSVALDARTERRYFADLSARMLDIVKITSVLVVIMGIGAAFAVANTLYAAVDGRRREIAMLRTIGFSRKDILTSFVFESALIGAAGATVGLLGGLWFDGYRQDYLSDQTWSVLAFEMKVTPEIVLFASFVAIFVAVVGALAPALRASRVQVIEALRKA
ncbi:MAG: ABC transporter permease [Planctomycetes bacterium]|nr:ABC transporter permease [Planctomycetota bacterium]